MRFPGRSAGRYGAIVRRVSRSHMPPIVRHTVCVQDAFGYVLFGVVGVGVLVALGTLFLRKATYEQIGAGGFFKEDPAAARAAGAAESDPFRDEEIRQMLTARNARHTLNGGEIVDVEVELARLTAPAVDAELVAEIREFVVKRNERRISRGQEPLDVEAEVARRVAELG